MQKEVNDLKMKNAIAAIGLGTIIFLSMFLVHLPLVRADYTVQNPSMPLDSDDLNSTCAMKTGADGYFYVPNLNVKTLKIEFTFNGTLVGDQTGGVSPYSNVTAWPDGTVDVYDALLLSACFGATEGGANWNYMADIVPDGVIDIYDCLTLSAHWGHSGTYNRNLTGVTVLFNTGTNSTLDSGGYVGIPQGASSFTVYKNNNPTGALVVFGTGPASPPVAYSTRFEFDVPGAPALDAGKRVWYYVMTTVYAPNPSGQEFYLSTNVANANESVQNVKLDGISKAGNANSFDLGAISGYHLLEFEFVDVCDVSGGGSLNFYVATQGGTNARLARFRLYVPNYSDAEYIYSVTTTAWCTMKDDYYLTGAADDYICNIHIDGLVWQDWEWNCSPYDTIYAWGDGFCYPLGNLENNTGQNAYSLGFEYGEIWGGGMLDFQYASWTNQREKIGNPKYWSTTDFAVIGNGQSIYSAKTSWGSKWNGNPGTSLQSYATTVELQPNATDPEVSPFPYKAKLGVSISNLPLAIGMGSVVDMGIFFNLTDESPSSAQWLSPMVDVNSIKIYTASNAIQIAPTALQYHDTSQTSFISPQLTVVGDFAGDLSSAYLAWEFGVMGVAAFGPVGALGGALVGATIGQGITQIFHFAGGQTVTKQYEAPGNSTYRKLSMDSFFTGWNASTTEALFARVGPTDEHRCGCIKVVIQCTISFFYWYPTGDLAVGKPINVTTAILAPMFVN